MIDLRQAPIDNVPPSTERYQETGCVPSLEGGTEVPARGWSVPFRCLVGQRHFHFFPTGPVPVEKWFGYYRCPPCFPAFRPVLSAAAVVGEDGARCGLGQSE